MDPVSRYKYDALYRLTEATGRELSNLSIPTHKDFENDIPSPDTDANAMRNYTQKFAYDAIGNMQYVKNEGQWTRNYHYMDNNYLLNHDLNNTKEVYRYDLHGNMLQMQHLSFINWDFKDQLISAGNETFISYYHYDMEGNRTRKIIVKGNIIEEYYYICGFELYRKYNNFTLETERKEVAVSNDEKVFLRMQTRTTNGHATTVSRYQYDNHLGSACLELDYQGDIISYEEYYTFGSTSYRSGKNETEVSLKRYKYCGKEKDEETGLYYYGMRYYADWLCRFISVDPLQCEYPESSPYDYCVNNPIKFIDPDGCGIVPQDEFLESVYGPIFEKLMQTNQYKDIVKGYSVISNLYLSYNENLKEYGITGGQVEIIRSGPGTKPIVISAETQTEYGQPFGLDQNEIGMVKTLLHEAIHARNVIEGIENPQNHDGFDRASVYKGLMEYNELFSLGYTEIELDIISWGGLFNSKEFKEYINERAETNQTSYEYERILFSYEYNDLIRKYDE